MKTPAPVSRSRRNIAFNAAAGILGLVVIAVLAVFVVGHTATSPSQRTTSVSTSSTATSSAGPTPPASGAGRLFAGDSVWNEALTDDTPVAANSDALAKRLVDSVATGGDWINTYAFSAPVYVVAGTQPTVPVVLDAGTGSTSRQLAAAFAAGVPIPSDARAAAGTDEHMVVLQPSTDTMWEFWHMRMVGDSWHADWGGKMTNLTTNPGYFDDPPDWGATATSIPLLAGMIRFADLRAGRIDHALAISVPDTSSAHVLPAQRSDGTDTASDAIPEGTEFRIRPQVDLDALRLSPTALMIARAAQRYGMIVRDQSPSVDFYGQQPTPGEHNPWSGRRGVFQGKSASQSLQGFPWKDVEVVAPR